MAAATPAPAGSASTSRSEDARRRNVMLVTGSTGFVGRHLVRHESAQRWEVIAPSSTTLDITRRDVVLSTIHDLRPDAIIHLAYRKGERDTIVDGSRHVAEAAAGVGARLVHVSTDVVFPGGPAAFTELDEPDPVIDYGQDKWEAERAVRDVAPHAVVVRTSLVYGTELLSPPQEQLHDELCSTTGRTASSYFSDEYRCPVHADDLAAALIQLAGRPDLAGPLHVTGSELVSRLDLARRFARQLGFERQLDRIRSSTVADSGMVRPARIDLDVSAAAELGIRCRPVSAVLP